MSLLTVLSIVYAVILVLALAAGLIAIVYFLRRARQDLAGIATGLEQVNRNVEPLSKALTAVNDRLEVVSDHLRKADDNLAPARPEEAGERRAG